MKISTSFPKIEALRDLSKLSARMKMPGGNSSFQQVKPENTNEYHLRHNLNNEQPHVQQNAIAPSGHAMAEQDASKNPEEFMSKMKNSRLNRIKGIAF